MLTERSRLRAQMDLERRAQAKAAERKRIRERQDAAAAVPTSGAAVGSRHEAVRSSGLVLLATLVRELGARMLPHMPTFVPRLLDLLETALPPPPPTTEAAAAGATAVSAATAATAVSVARGKTSNATGMTPAGRSTCPRDDGATPWTADRTTSCAACTPRTTMATVDSVTAAHTGSPLTVANGWSSPAYTRSGDSKYRSFVPETAASPDSVPEASSRSRPCTTVSKWQNSAMAHRAVRHGSSCSNVTDTKLGPKRQISDGGGAGNACAICRVRRRAAAPKCAAGRGAKHLSRNALNQFGWEYPF